MGKVITSFTGLRAREVNEDFVIGEAEDVPDFINAAGIESPGLTSAPAIGEMVREIIYNKLKPELKEDFIGTRKGIVRFHELPDVEKSNLIKERPEYGNIICRCEWVTEGEIIDAIRSPLGATTLDGIKRRTRAGAGRCQAGFCMPKTIDILCRELKLSPFEITKFGRESNILIDKNKDSI
jgi:glycerol-3-phosphate dehydrogenase